MFFFMRGKFLYAVALSIFKSKESEIFACTEADEVVVFFKKEAFASDLLKAAFRIMDTLDIDNIEELKNAGKFEVIRTMEKNSKSGAIKKILSRGSKFEYPELSQLYASFIAVAQEHSIDFGRFQQLTVQEVPWLEFRIDLLKIMFGNQSTMNFECFVDTLAIPAKGTLKERLELFLTLHDRDNDSELDKAEYYLTLDALVR
jgi:hypothetical protein